MNRAPLLLAAVVLAGCGMPAPDPAPTVTVTATPAPAQTTSSVPAGPPSPLGLGYVVSTPTLDVTVLDYVRQLSVDGVEVQALDVQACVSSPDVAGVAVPTSGWTLGGNGTREASAIRVETDRPLRDGLLGTGSCAEGLLTFEQTPKRPTVARWSDAATTTTWKLRG